MLEPTTNDHHHDAPLPAFEEIDSAAPLSVSAPRATAVALQAPNRPADRLSDLVARSEMALVHLESRLNDERSASERAVRATAEMEERLRLGVRMLQALDMQVERGEQAGAHLFTGRRGAFDGEIGFGGFATNIGEAGRDWGPN